jgi:hypothetical protein
MALLAQFDTPASLRDMPVGSPFYTDWHSYLAGRLPATAAGSGTATGSEFYDPTETDVNVVAARTLTWMAFPRRVLLPNLRDDRARAFEDADKPNPGNAFDSRFKQDEYCEWFVTRNKAGKINKVTFTTETPEYWERMWNVDRAAVVSLYRALVSPAVVEADLRIGGAGGPYNRRNKWNSTHGIVHLQQNINNLDAAIGLALGSMGTGSARDGFEMSSVANTSVDPRVVHDIGMLARKGFSITLQDPVGLYMVGWDDTGFTKPDGSPVGNYWRIVRGTPGRVLRLEYEVPAGAGFVVGDIRIGGRRIEWGGHLAEHVTVGITGVVGTRATR